jgi:hypothetical protein
VEEAANEAVFEFPSVIRLYLLPAAVVCCVMVLFAITAPSLSTLGVAVLVSFVAAVQLIFFSRLRYRVAVSNDGIRYMPYADAPIFLQWSEVASLELREGIGAAQLAISDASRLRKMILDYRLDKFQDLLSIVVDRAANCDPHPPLPKTFHTSYLDQSVIIAVFLVCIVLSIYFAEADQSVYATAFGLFAVLPVCILAALPRSLSVSTNSLELRYLGRRRQIALASVTGVRFGLMRGNRGLLWTVVWLDTIEDRPLKLTGFTEGSLAVYYALRDAWRPMKE